MARVDAVAAVPLVAPRLQLGVSLWVERGRRVPDQRPVGPGGGTRLGLLAEQGHHAVLQGLGGQSGGRREGRGRGQAGGGFDGGAKGGLDLEAGRVVARLALDVGEAQAGLYRGVLGAHRGPAADEHRPGPQSGLRGPHSLDPGPVPLAAPRRVHLPLLVDSLPLLLGGGSGAPVGLFEHVLRERDGHAGAVSVNVFAPQDGGSVALGSQLLEEAEQLVRAGQVSGLGAEDVQSVQDDIVSR